MKFDGDSARTECVFGKIASRRSDLDGAYAHYSRAFALNPGDAEAQIGLGRVLATMGKPQEAAKYLRMAVQSDPLNDEAHYRLASVCKRLQLKDEAEKELRLFREIKQAKERLGELYWQMNKKPPGAKGSDPRCGAMKTQPPFPLRLLFCWIVMMPGLWPAHSAATGIAMNVAAGAQGDLTATTGRSAPPSQQPPEPTDITPLDGEVYYVVNQLSGLQADLNNNSTTAGDHIVQQQRSFTNLSQRWAFTGFPAASGGSATFAMAFVSIALPIPA